MQAHNNNLSKSIESDLNNSTISDLESSINFNQLREHLTRHKNGDDALKMHRSKSEAIYCQQQIPKYDSSTINTTSSTMLSKIGSRSFKIPTSSSSAAANIGTNGSDPTSTNRVKPSMLSSSNPDHALSGPSESPLAYAPSDAV